MRNLLVVGEMALPLVLLTAGGLMVKSVLRLQATELGFVPDSRLSIRLALPRPEYTPARAAQFFMSLIDRLESQPGIQSIAFGSCAPLSGGCNRTSALTESFSLLPSPFSLLFSFRLCVSSAPPGARTTSPVPHGRGSWW